MNNIQCVAAVKCGMVLRVFLAAVLCEVRLNSVREVVKSVNERERPPYISVCFALPCSLSSPAGLSWLLALSILPLQKRKYMGERGEGPCDS